jgi:hypothetical protein
MARMSTQELHNKVVSVVNEYVERLSLAETLGVLAITMMDVYMAASSEDEEDEEEEEEVEEEVDGEGWKGV